MLGKDYMLAIIIVNYDDNIWNDQNLELDSDLPPGWRTIRDSTGTYYWHIPTGATQWQHPSYSAEDEPDPRDCLSTCDQKGFSATGRRGSRNRLTESPVASINDRASQEYYFTNTDPDSKCFAVRSLGWVEIPEEDLTPGKSSIAVNNCIQQLSHSKSEGCDAMGAWGEGQDMVMILKKDTLSLVDPLDHSLIHCQPIINIRVWGVGCNNGRDRDFAFVASDKDTCMLKCHVFRCDVPAKAIASALHGMCSKIMAEKEVMPPSMPWSLTMESISPEDLPLQVDFLDTVRQKAQKFRVEYIGYLPVPRAMGMEVLNKAIENIMDTTDREEWEPAIVHVTDTVLSLWKGEDGGDPLWECQVRYLTFLGVGHDTHTFAVIVDAGTQRFECHVFWCEPDAGIISEAVQAACMVQYQKCLVAQTPPLKPKMWRSGSKVRRANSVDSSSFPPRHRGHSPPKFGTSNVKKGVLAFFETFRNKQSVVPMP
ncbi:amyloid-beta A4 precursor protein-binding family B member 3-like isoform X1 [Megalops cyprinoides]|uniref:amyloid-beta A4 precursor protein-binding family B member 3-like isoform X1 n=1 Tax=Megalops cyprinoides TaxID=118141 RepID=UPI00186428F6|nr:amyloid-beta A4 precursor protein-binding family B member 3-like isoform X1 [Megalops cyprinoides]